VAALIVAMVAVSIAGSAWWRPEPISRETLPLGGARPVRDGARLAADSISSVLETVGPSLAFLIVPELARSGSGVVVHEDGFVVTNAHVVEGVRELLVAFDDDEQYRAVVYGVDRSTDLAVVKVEADHPLPAAPLGDSDELRVGEFVVALGAPFGLEATATSGIVSGLHRSGLGIARFEDFIVTDAPINRGNSGGPLVNLRGEVVGINTAIIADDAAPHGMGTFAGVGFAIPVNVMRVVAQRLIGDGAPRIPESAGAIEADGPGTTAGDAGPAPGDPKVVATPAGLTAARAVGSGRVGASSPGYAPCDPSIAMVKTFDRKGRRIQRGTGFVISTDDGPRVITNEHVVRDARHVDLFFCASDSYGYFSVAGIVVADEPGRDLALIEIPSHPRMVPLRLGDADALAVGDTVASVFARPRGQGLQVARQIGHVIETGLFGHEELGAAPWASVVAIDLDVEHGDSGGPLVDASGAVVGVVVARRQEDHGAEGAERRGFAVLFREARELTLLIEPGFEPGATVMIDDEQPEISFWGVEADGWARASGLDEADRIIAIDGDFLPAGPFARRELWDAFLRRLPGTDAMLMVQHGDDAEAPRETIRVVIPDRSREP
jgi:S1-C subfamily serine protease